MLIVIVKEVNMHNGRPWLTAVLALVGGMIGAGMMMFGASSAFALRRAPSTRTVEAEQFVLLGPNRARRGIIEVSDKGTAALYLNDENGKERTELRVTADGTASLTFFDAGGNQRVVVGDGASPQGQAGIGVFSADGTQVASLSSIASGEVNMTLYDNKTGLARAGLGLAADGAPALVLFDQNGKDRAELHVNSAGRPGLAMVDENGKSLIAGFPMQQPAQ
jgi:hypothetical protein